jgi:hypothetical protein
LLWARLIERALGQKSGVTILDLICKGERFFEVPDDLPTLLCLTDHDVILPTHSSLQANNGGPKQKTTAKFSGWEMQIASFWKVRWFCIRSDPYRVEGRAYDVALWLRRARFASL